MSDALTPYENGLKRLLKLLEEIDKNHTYHTEVQLYQLRLLENIRRTRLYSDTDMTRAERMEVLGHLNALSMKTIGRSFMDLCDFEHQPFSSEPFSEKLSVTKNEKEFVKESSHNFIDRQPNDGKISAADLKKLEQYRKEIQSIKKTLDNSLTQYEFTDESLDIVVQRLDNIRKFFVTLEQINPTGYDKLAEAALYCLQASCIELNLAREELSVRKRRTRNYFIYIFKGQSELDRLLRVW